MQNKWFLFLILWINQSFGVSFDDNIQFTHGAKFIIDGVFDKALVIGLPYEDIRDAKSHLHSNSCSKPHVLLRGYSR